VQSGGDRVPGEPAAEGESSLPPAFDGDRRLAAQPLLRLRCERPGGRRSRDPAVIRVRGRIIAAFDLLRLSIRGKDEPWTKLLSRAWFSLTAAAGAAIFCQSEWFLTAAVWPTHLVGTFALPRPVYGQYWYLYAVYFSLATLVLIIKTSRDIRSAAGRERAELAFILIVGILTLVVSLPLGIILGYFIDPAKALWFAPFRVLLFGLVMAYGIATRKVMEVGFFLRRAMSYLVLTAYLLALYGIVWWLVSRVFTPVFPDGSNSLAHVMALARSGLRHGARPRHHAVVCEPSVHRHARPRLPHDDEQGDRDSAVGHDAPRFAAALREDDRRCRWDRPRADSARVAHCLRASPSAANGN
jgi:hypothetical protein